MSLRAIHDFSVALLDPILAMTERGIAINEPLRHEMMLALQLSVEPLREQVTGIVTPLLNDKVPRAKLFREKWTCPCCRGGSSKAGACWSCAGYDKKPTKAQLSKKFGEGEFAMTFTTELQPCLVCNGEGKRESWRFNTQSDPQKAIVLYDLLKLPRRTRDGKPKVDEDTLKDLLAYDKQGVVWRLLKIAKVSTMLEIFERIAPDKDGRIRCFLNPAGTETGRLAGSGSFLQPSTNLLNMPKTEAAKDPMYKVRRVFVPSEGMTLVEGDLSGAEAWIVAALTDDKPLIERMHSQDFKVHRWTAAYLFGKPEDEVCEIDYFLGKKARHAGNYGMSWARLMQEVNALADETGVSITAQEAKRLLEGIHKLHPGLQRWWKRVAQQLEDKGYIESIFGFRRTFFGRRRHTNKWLDDVHKEAIAFEPQHTVAYLGLRALLRWWEQYQAQHQFCIDGVFQPVGYLLLNVYDSLLVESEWPSHAGAALQKCLEEEITINNHTFTIPAEISVGSNWADLKEVGDCQGKFEKIAAARKTKVY